ncbi:MAG TPA: SDR family NAD(P)-dependent oxidoreductase [Polyangiales bacterium]|nr:SDR family NAD(P)-dependent oxidoreductase [Polyangiales bacterium]
MARTILVTGATDGLGRGVALALARRGDTVLIHGRDERRIARTLDELKHAAPRAELRSYRADFAELAQVRELARQILGRETQLDVLINNAGIGTQVPGGPLRQVSHEGYELRLAVNYLAPFLLTRLLLPLIERSAPARIVNISSLGQQAIDFDDPMLERGYSGVRAYCQSKLAQILFTIDLAEPLGSRNVSVLALHPATYMPTKIVASPVSSLEEGIAATVRLAAEPDLAAVSGKFFDGPHERRADAQAYDPEARRKLRVLSEKLTGLSPLAG